MVILRSIYFRILLFSLIFTLVCYLVNTFSKDYGMNVVTSMNRKEIFDYPLYEAMDDLTIILVKVFIDVLMILLCVLNQFFKRQRSGKRQTFGISLILLKCIDVLLFVIISWLFVHGWIDDMFDETSTVFGVSVFLSIGYFVFVSFLYCLMCLRHRKSSNRDTFMEYI